MNTSFSLLQSTLDNPSIPDCAFWVDEFDLASVIQTWGDPIPRKNVAGGKINIGGTTYERGIWVHAICNMEIHLHGQAEKFYSYIGIEDGRLSHGAKPEEGTVLFQAFVDGVLKSESKLFSGSGVAEPFEVDLTGGEILNLRVTKGLHNSRWSHGAWANAFILMNKAFSKAPHMKAPEPSAPLNIASISRTEKGIAPYFTGATRVGASPGKPFLHRLTALGSLPLRFQAQSLPPGLRFDENSGIICGQVPQAGSWRVPVAVSNDSGKCSGTLEIIIGKNCLALTPPMGWNSWNVWGEHIDRDKILAAAHLLIETRLADVGYQYVNMDDGWQRHRYDFEKYTSPEAKYPHKLGRDADGRILACENFGDMRTLADEIHRMGLKIGIYSSPGAITCAKYDGSFQFELSDAKRFADWGMDYIKYDWCSYYLHAGSKSPLSDLQKPYRLMKECLDQVDRDIVYSICQYGLGDVSRWGEEVGGQLWRTDSDMFDRWQSMISQAHKVLSLSNSCKPGAWHDPDMLVVGNIGWGKPHPTKLTPNEQVTHISLWSLLSAPMLLGCDLTKMDDWLLNLLLNPEVVAINQDSLGAHPRLLNRFQNDDRCICKDIWVKQLHDGTHAVGLLNWGRGTTEISVQWKELGLFPSQPVRDLWQQKDLGTISEGVSYNVPEHGTILLKVGKPLC